jgi:hypothetical protein
MIESTNLFSVLEGKLPATSCSIREVRTAVREALKVTAQTSWRPFREILKNLRANDQIPGIETSCEHQVQRWYSFTKCTSGTVAADQPLGHSPPCTPAIPVP